ncbi:hypothetical protein PWR05_15710 [Paraburkholderia sp. A2RI-6]
MLRSLVVILMMVVTSGLVSAETLVVDIGHDGHADKAIVSQQGHAGTVAIYEDAKLVGKFDNLIVDQPALSSNVITLTGGGLAIEIDSDGSRNKFHMIAPIRKADGRFYVDCIYKSIYDSVDETISVGTSCAKLDLGKLDVSSAINDNGLKHYGADHVWLKEIPAATCSNAVGFEYSNYRIARCAADGASDTRKQKIVAYDKQGKTLFSVAGYELIPGADGKRFLLTGDLQAKTVVFEGNFDCFAQDTIPTSDISGKARVAHRLNINFTLGSVGGCLIGHYSYAGRGEDIVLRGLKRDGLTYLLELGANNVSTGMFVLDRLDSGARGGWISVPQGVIFPSIESGLLRQFRSRWQALYLIRRGCQNFRVQGGVENHTDGRTNRSA